MSAATASWTNPFPGLRPFREDEEYLFFGRENQVDAMVNKLAGTRFLAVVGTSGSGKSSLINCGLRPALRLGLMARAGTAWRMAQFRPGSHPIGAMARALAQDGVLFRDHAAAGLSLAEIVETSLRMSKLGLIDIFEQAALDKDVNLLVVVDQFEELFRYRQIVVAGRTDAQGISEDTAAFVNLLLEAKEQATCPIFVILTMRSDFLGDCAQFPGLAEAINAGQYLVPRMTRDERRSAIVGPIAVAGAEIAPVLVTRLVNDVGDNPDQLSILQHALNRTWARWQHEGGGQGPLDLPHYEAIGSMSGALDGHAERAYAELSGPRQRQICEKLFKALTDKATDPRGVRRPIALRNLCELAKATLPDVTDAELTAVIDVFRKPSRSFLMPPAGEAIEAETVIDISHESLMRVWKRLITWADEEARSAEMYRRLANTSMLHAADKAGLWRDPDLQLALDWREKEKPTSAWAGLYQGGFEAAMSFLEKSREARDFEVAEDKFKLRLGIVRNVILCVIVASLLVGPFALNNLKIAHEPYSITIKLTESLTKKLTESSPGVGIAVVAITPEAFNEIRKEYSSFVTGALGIPNRVIAEAQPIETTFFSLLDTTEDEDFNKDHPHLPVALKASHVVLSTKLTDTDFKNLKVKEKTKAALVNALKEFESPSSNKSYASAGQSYIFVVPSSVDMISSADKQPILIKTALNYSSLENLLTTDLDRADQMLAASTLFVHLFAYFLLGFSVGAVYRRFAFRAVGGVADSAASQSPWETRWQSLGYHLSEFLKRVQSPRWKTVWSVILLLIGLVLFGAGLYRSSLFSSTSNEVWAADLILPLGVILILLVPPAPLLKRSGAPRFKVTQGILLQLAGFYAFALAVCFLLDRGSFGPGLVISGVGLVIVILGKRKCFLTADETLAREPNRPPIVYLRSHKPNRKGKRGAGMGRFFRSDDEQLLRPIFETLGPFVTVEPPEEDLLNPGAVDVSGNQKERRQQEIELLRRSALVILQIDDRLTDGLRSEMRLTLQALNPEQVLVYFSQEMDAGQLRIAYQNFVDATRNAIPGVLPSSVDTNRFLAFDKGWQPFLCGALTRPKFSWGKVLPLLGSSLDVVRLRRVVVRTMKPLFDRWNQVNPQTKLYGDFAIGLAAFPLFGLGIPAGVMIFRNLWSMGRRWTAAIGLVAPFVGFVAAVVLTGAVLTALVAGSVNSRHVREAYGLLLMVWVGFPFATYWLWRRLSGREIRLHAAFGGPLQPRWQSLVLLVSGPLVLSTFYFYYATIQKKRRDTQIAVYEGRHLAEIGDVKSAIAAFQKAQRLDPDIDLDPTTKSIEKDPQAVAQKFADLGAPKRKLQEAFGLARLHDTDKALKAYAEAEKLDPLLATDANFWNRRAWYLTLGGNAKSGLEASEKAVRLAGKYLPNYRDTRGVARALTGDTQGAIQDFEAFIASEPLERKKAQRQEWINALRRGQMPFTPELLETLWSQ